MPASRAHRIPAKKSAPPFRLCRAPGRCTARPRGRRADDGRAGRAVTERSSCGPSTPWSPGARRRRAEGDGAGEPPTAGGLASMPLSMTATLMPAPVAPPQAHSSWGRERQRRDRPSSVTKAAGPLGQAPPRDPRRSEPTLRRICPASRAAGSLCRREFAERDRDLVEGDAVRVGRRQVSASRTTRLRRDPRASGPGRCRGVVQVGEPDDRRQLGGDDTQDGQVLPACSPRVCGSSTSITPDSLTGRPPKERRGWWSGCRRLLGDVAREPGVCADVGDGDRLSRHRHPARDAADERERDADDGVGPGAVGRNERQ